MTREEQVKEILRNSLYRKHPQQSEEERVEAAFERLRPYLVADDPGSFGL